MLGRELLDDKYCQGVASKVSDPTALARAIALALVQEYALARSILLSNPGPQNEVRLRANEIEDIVARRLKPLLRNLGAALDRDQEDAGQLDLDNWRAFASQVGSLALNRCADPRGRPFPASDRLVGFR